MTNPMLYPTVAAHCERLARQFDAIPQDRKVLLAKIADFIRERKTTNRAIRLMFVCTHNSRRSHFGQVAAAVGAAYYGVPAVEVYSGGTEATAFHPNAIAALRDLGFGVHTEEAQAANPTWEVRFGEGERVTTCFSKVYNHEVNPTEDVAAVMTCSDAEQNCPYIPGVALRIATTYTDPKVSDGTPQQAETYGGRFEQILTEMLYAFSLA